MLEFKVQLSRAGSLNHFVEEMNKIPGTVMLIGNDRKVNAKSLLGLLNTSQSEILTLEIDSTEADIKDVMPFIQQITAT